MRLSSKLIAIFMLATLTILTIDSVIMVKRQIAVFRADLENDAVRVVETTSEILAKVAPVSGAEFALSLLDGAATWPVSIQCRPVHLIIPPSQRAMLQRFEMHFVGVEIRAPCAARTTLSSLSACTSSRLHAGCSSTKTTRLEWGSMVFDLAA